MTNSNSDEVALDGIEHFAVRKPEKVGYKAEAIPGGDGLLVIEDAHGNRTTFIVVGELYLFEGNEEQ